MESLKNSVLYLGDNLEILKKYIPDKSVDLVYLDPPFASNRDYSINHGENTGRDGKPRTRAFTDTWKWDGRTEEAMSAIEKNAPEGLRKLVGSVVEVIGRAPVPAYLVMMVPRLLELHRVLKETGSVYLHCDPTASHYLKLVLDCIFGAENFRNEIAWTYRGGGRSSRYFARKHDTILFYTKSGRWTFNFRDILVERENRTYFTDGRGRKYWLKYGRRYYLKNEGKVPEDWWSDITPLHGPYRERLGYPTQKPLALLERIIKVSSSPGDIVLDPFCGCGTALVAAQKLERRWVGIDIAPEAIELTSKRLTETFLDLSFERIGG
jgi:site-specific DNA-methyltransferase (adenine-specific)